MILPRMGIARLSTPSAGSLVEQVWSFFLAT